MLGRLLDLVEHLHVSVFANSFIVRIASCAMEESKQETDVEATVKVTSSKESTSDGATRVEDEHSQSFMQALKLYPTAVGWSMFFSLGIIMTAFDPQLLGSLFATPAFQKDFGYLYGDSYIVSAPWQTALGMGNPIGQVVGALGAGYPMEWYGRKPVNLYICRYSSYLTQPRHSLRAWF
jgi:SP family general alpha glucoside:H+ symporter-like MFS transporter